MGFAYINELSFWDAYYYGQQPVFRFYVDNAQDLDEIHLARKPN